MVTGKFRLFPGKFRRVPGKFRLWFFVFYDTRLINLCCIIFFYDNVFLLISYFFMIAIYCLLYQIFMIAQLLIYCLLYHIFLW